MVGGGDRYVRSEHDLIADIDVAVVDQRQIRVRIDQVAEMHMVSAPVRVERELDKDVPATFSKDLAEVSFLLRKISRPQEIEFEELLLEHQLLVYYLLVAGIV